LDLLRGGAHALADHLQPSGELHDPVFGEPTQYGTAYYAYVNATLASLSRGAEQARYVDAAERGLRATLRHLLDPADPTPAADFTRDVASPSTQNLRDFMWPPVIRTLRLLRQIGRTDIAPLVEQISRVAVPDAFQKLPPVNWAAVWLSGEWLRIGDGMSPHMVDDVDKWIEPFFTDKIDLECGFYHEPGLPNSYDLFTRVHLLYLLADGYDGSWRGDLERLLVTGLRRSLAVQLSSGSLPSAHRSTAHLWTLLAQVSYFHQAAGLLREPEPALAAAADAAARRAFAAAQACQRPTGDLSPVENVLPANYRVGYEVYTMEAHYVSLPLGFLATAVLAGFTGEGEVVIDTEPRTHVEAAPVHRSLVHADGWSVHLNLNPHSGYQPNDPIAIRPDAFGIADVTLGPGRRLRLGGQVHHMAEHTPLTIGVALRGADRSVTPLSAANPVGNQSAHADGRRLEASAELEGGLSYRVEVEVDGDVVRIVEGIDGHQSSLLVPYLRDRGDGVPTEVVIDEHGVRLTAGDEIVAVAPAGRIERAVHLPHGYESRHGLVGLVRLDLAQPGPVSYQIRRIS
jgi:hypothetical protein